MTYWLALGGGVLLVTLGGGLGTYLRCPGCLDRGRVNTACRWVGDTPYALDPRDASQRAHLSVDAQLAEELAIRHADAEHGRRFGVDHHGGLLDGGRFRQACLSRMFAAIERAHGVDATLVQAARGRRPVSFDTLTALLFVPLFAVGALGACVWLSRRFAADGWRVHLAAATLASIVASILGLQGLRLWLAVWEVVRLGNGHVATIRAATFTRWNQLYPGAELLAGLVLFWLVALWWHRVGRHQAPDSPHAH